MKDAGMRIRVEPELREAFIRLCRDKDMPAARVLRAFMKDFVEREEGGLQIALSFKEQEPEKKSGLHYE